MTKRESPNAYNSVRYDKVAKYNQRFCKDRDYMITQMKARLEAKGWKVGTVSELLNLTPDDEAAIEARLALDEAKRSVARLIVSTRGKDTTQAQIAERQGLYT